MPVPAHLHRAHLLSPATVREQQWQADAQQHLRASAQQQYQNSQPAQPSTPPGRELTPYEQGLQGAPPGSRTVPGDDYDNRLRAIRQDVKETEDRHEREVDQYRLTHPR